MQERIERKRLAMLRVLREADAPVGSQQITAKLQELGYDISERTVRFDLLAMDNAGYTQYIGKRGRKITEKGKLELSSAMAHERVGFLIAKIDQLTYLMKFDLAKRRGSVVVNTSLIEKKVLQESYRLVQKVFEAGYAMGRLLALFGPGTRVGDIEVPSGFVGLGTICSITINGVLLSHGIPTFSRFGGLLEMRKREPQRFTAIINYDGTSLDPLEIFIRSGMTDYVGATETGTGHIGASFREVPAASRDQVLEIADKLEKIGLGGFMEIGWPGQPLLGVPVDENRIGAIVIGGLNPVAILEETGVKVYSRALSGLTDFECLFPFDQLGERIAKTG
jgi:HTH-type transcriptional regulator, global nitrogen regulator NrpRI